MDTQRTENYENEDFEPEEEEESKEFGFYRITTLELVAIELITGS